MKRQQKQTKRRSCSQLVIDRSKHTDEYDRVTLKCGHELLVNFEQEHHICPHCQNDKYQKLSHSFNWCLQTKHGFVLTVNDLFKPPQTVERATAKRFLERRVAERYAKILKVSTELEAIHWRELEDETV